MAREKYMLREEKGNIFIFKKILGIEKMK